MAPPQIHSFMIKNKSLLTNSEEKRISLIWNKNWTAILESDKYLQKHKAKIIIMKLQMFSIWGRE